MHGLSEQGEEQRQCSLFFVETPLTSITAQFLVNTKSYRSTAISMSFVSVVHMFWKSKIESSAISCHKLNKK